MTPETAKMRKNRLRIIVVSPRQFRPLLFVASFIATSVVYAVFKNRSSAETMPSLRGQQSGMPNSFPKADLGGCAVKKNSPFAIFFQVFRYCLTKIGECQGGDCREPPALPEDRPGVRRRKAGSTHSVNRCQSGVRNCHLSRMGGKKEFLPQEGEAPPLFLPLEGEVPSLFLPLEGEVRWG